MLLFYCMDTLSEIVKPLSGNKRQFILMRVSGLDVGVSRDLIGVARSTYDSWFHHEVFVQIHRQLPDLIATHRQEAIQMLRRDNQLEAVLLEGKLIKKMKEEVDSGELKLCKTNLGREVYSKLISELDAPITAVKQLTYEQRISQFFPQPNEQLEQGKGEHIDGEFKEIGVEQTEHQESLVAQEGEPTGDEDTQEAQE